MQAPKTQAYCQKEKSLWLQVRRSQCKMRSPAVLVVGLPLVLGVADKPPLDSKPISPAGPLLPFCRKQAHAATIWLPVHDADMDKIELEQRVVFFGGKGIDYVKHPKDDDQEDFLNDLWSLHITNNGFVWRQLGASSTKGNGPPARWKFAMSAYNSSTALAIYGGDDESMGLPNYLDDLWLYTPNQVTKKTPAWSEVSIGGTSPGARRGGAMAVTSDHSLVYHGGKPFDNDLECDSRTFSLDLESLHSGTRQWSERAPLPVECRWGHSFTTVTAYPISADSYASKIKDSSSDNDSGKDDTPQDKTEDQASDENADDNTDGGDYGDKGSGGHRALTKSKKSSSSSSSSTSSSNAPKGEERIVLFGGRRYEGMAYRYFNELWSYDLSQDHWEMIKPLPSVQIEGSVSEADSNASHSLIGPTARDHHASTYVPELDSLFIHGGRYTDLKVPALADVWSFNFKTLEWKLHAQTSMKRPTPRFAHSMAAWRGGSGDGSPSLVIIGGETINASGGHNLLNDVWMFNIADGAWRKVGRSACGPGATGEVVEPVVGLNVLLLIAGIIMFGGIGLVIYRFYQSRNKQPYVRIPRETRRSSLP